ncbi:MAG: DUF2075 domain-containing protein [Bacteroidetes bacterium]|jgi:hypothetical protein|nr:DUF2075 domain-containing protein [Bacteroidota bacterium]
MLWLIKEESINEIGCIDTCQGLELNYVGVIIGPDFKIRTGIAVTDAYERSINDRSIFGIKKMMREEPEKAKELAETIFKNTYRTLMSLGMKGCYIYCIDKETAEYFRKMVWSRLIIKLSKMMDHCVPKMEEIQHYQKIIVALMESDLIMGEVDGVFEIIDKKRQ